MTANLGEIVYLGPPLFSGFNTRQKGDSLPSDSGLQKQQRLRGGGLGDGVRPSTHMGGRRYTPVGILY